MALTKAREAVLTQANWVLTHGAQWLYYEIRPIPITAIRNGAAPREDGLLGLGDRHLREGEPARPERLQLQRLGEYGQLLLALRAPRLVHRRGAGHLVDAPSQAGAPPRLPRPRTHHPRPQSLQPRRPTRQAPPDRDAQPVKDYWYSTGHVFTGLRALPIAEKAPSWVVLNGPAPDRHHEPPVRWAIAPPTRSARTRSSSSSASDP